LARRSFSLSFSFFVFPFPSFFKQTGRDCCLGDLWDEKPPTLIPPSAGRIRGAFTLLFPRCLPFLLLVGIVLFLASFEFRPLRSFF